MSLPTKIQIFIQTLRRRWHQYQRAQARQQMIAQAQARRAARIENLADRVMAIPEVERERFLQLIERLADLKESQTVSRDGTPTR